MIEMNLLREANLAMAREESNMEPAPRPAAFFVGDHLAIDFLNSRSTLSGVWTEWLRDGSDLINWLEQASAIETEVAAKYRAGDEPEHVLDEIVEQARSLREWFRLFVVRHAGRELGADAVAD